MNDIQKESVHVGAHEFQFVPPHRISFIMRGTFEQEHAKAYVEFLSMHVDRCGEPLDGLFDLSALTTISSGARKQLGQQSSTLLFHAIAIVGASFSIRTVSSMLLRAGKILAPQKTPANIYFCDVAKEANAWFDELRSKRN